jgi:hypothetical protein
MGDFTAGRYHGNPFVAFPQILGVNLPCTVEWLCSFAVSLGNEVIVCFSPKHGKILF